MVKIGNNSGTDGVPRVDRGVEPSCEELLAPDYLRRIARIEAMPENASGADKTWVHRAHADAVRHFDSAKRR